MIGGHVGVELGLAREALGAVGAPRGLLVAHQHVALQVRLLVERLAAQFALERIVRLLRVGALVHGEVVLAFERLAAYVALEGLCFVTVLLLQREWDTNTHTKQKK